MSLAKPSKVFNTAITTKLATRYNSKPIPSASFQQNQFAKVTPFSITSPARLHTKNMLRFYPRTPMPHFQAAINLHFTNLRTDDAHYTSRIASSCNIIPNLLLLLLFLPSHLTIHIRCSVNNIHMEKV